jgi:hypothetical protein
MAMTTPATRWTWLAGDPPTVCRGFLAFVPALDRYVCSVLSNARVSHHLGETADDATNEARRQVEATYGSIRVDRPERHMADLRIGRWNGVPLLLGGREHGIPLQEDWVRAVSRGNSAQAQGYFARIVVPLLPEKQQVLLKDWVATGKWDTVPIDAVFAASYPDFDYLNE